MQTNVNQKVKWQKDVPVPRLRIEPGTRTLQGKCLTDRAKKAPIDLVYRNQNPSKSTPNFDFQSKISA